MKRLSIYALLCLLVISCNKESIKYEEAENYEVVEIVSSDFQTEYIDKPTLPFELGGTHLHPNSVFLINNKVEFDSLITNNNLRLLQTVDLEKQTLVGVYTTFMVSSLFIEFKYNVLKELESDKYLIRITCINYKETTSIEGFNEEIHWFILPKINTPSLVEFEIIQKNRKLEDFDISYLFNEYQGLLQSYEQNNEIMEKNTILKLEPIIEKKPNIMFSYTENNTSVVFGGGNITKFENRIVINGAELLIGPPLLETDYKLGKAIFQSDSKELFVEFWNSNDLITSKFSGVIK